MAIFKIKDVQKVMTAEIYEVEAETKEEALDLYINQLAGGLQLIDSFFVPDLDESITSYSE